MRVRYKISRTGFFYIFLSFFLVFSISIGRLFDPRIAVGRINISWIFAFFVLSGSLLAIINYRLLRSNLYFYLLIIFWLLISLSTIVYEVFFYYSPEVDSIALRKMINFFVFVLFPAFLIFLINDRDFIKKICYTIFLLALLMGIAGLLKLFITGFHFSNINRLAVLGGPIVFSRWMFAGAIFIVTVKPFGRLLNIFLIILFLVCSLFSASKGPLLAFILCLILGYLKWKRISFTRLLLNHRLYLAIIVAFLIIIPVFTTLMPGRLKDLTELNLNSTSAKGRIVRYLPTLQMITTHPQGVGTGRWALTFNQITGKKIALGQYPHNIVLEVISELGWFAGILLLVLLFRPFRDYSHIALWTDDKDDNKIGFFLYLYSFFFLINSMISGNINDSRFLFLGLTLMVWFKIYKLNEMKLLNLIINKE